MNETRILITLLWMYIPRNCEFGSALSKLRNFGGRGVESPKPPSVRHWSKTLCAGRLTRTEKPASERDLQPIPSPNHPNTLHQNKYFVVIAHVGGSRVYEFKN
jgi:hypothetical protein